MSEAAEKWVQENTEIVRSGSVGGDDKQFDNAVEAFDAGVASQRELLACGHPKACQSVHHRYCCESLDSNGNRTHAPDCKGKPFCAVCEEIESALASRDGEVAGLLGSFRKLFENVRSMQIAAEKCNEAGMAETPQKEWTPYQGKILAYGYVLDEIAKILDARRALNGQGDKQS